jgi:D-alanyl-D-alanine dipeptidase
MSGESEGKGASQSRYVPAAMIFVSAIVAAAPPADAAELPEGFVRLADIDPTIRQAMPYAGHGHYLGRPAEGYEAPVCILTEVAAAALSRVQKKLPAEGLTLVVLDCYRPEQAVSDLVRWASEGGPPDPRWHPQLRRDRLIQKGYITGRSAHSRGSTVDVAIAPLGDAPAHDPDCGARGLRTLDFGTGFDCFDAASGTAYPKLDPAVAENRRKLVQAMQAEGFRNFSGEWWHFTLEKEPFSSKRFDFPITAE